MVESTLETSTSKVLVVEDELEIRELIALLLLRQGYSVRQVATAAEASDILQKEQFHLVVLDWMLPQISGIELLKFIRAKLKEKIAVLMVTAKADPNDIVGGLDAGADDYLTKPFEPAVLQARVKALLRRVQLGSQMKEILRVGNLTLNLASYEVRSSGAQLHLTPSEFKILSTMAMNQGRVLTREHLIEVVQGEGISVTGRTIDTHVFGLRKKLGESADWIETIRGVGYRVKSEA